MEIALQKTREKCCGRRTDGKRENEELPNRTIKLLDSRRERENEKERERKRDREKENGRDQERKSRKNTKWLMVMLVRCLKLHSVSFCCCPEWSSSIMFFPSLEVCVVLLIVFCYYLFVLISFIHDDWTLFSLFQIIIGRLNYYVWTCIGILSPDYVQRGMER